jgi:hypothetical protein
MTFPDTDTTSNTTLAQQGWVFSIPLSVSASILDLPVLLELRDITHVYSGPVGDLQLAHEWLSPNITAEVHQRLLEQSLHEYREIWRILAEK